MLKYQEIERLTKTLLRSQSRNVRTLFNTQFMHTCGVLHMSFNSVTVLLLLLGFMGRK